MGSQQDPPHLHPGLPLCGRVGLVRNKGRLIATGVRKMSMAQLSRVGLLLVLMAWWAACSMR